VLEGEGLSGTIEGKKCTPFPDDELLSLRKEEGGNLFKGLFFRSW